MVTKELIQAIAATAELCGAKLSDGAARMLLADLDAYPEHAVIAALTRVRKSGKRFSLSAITDEMSEMDGRPGVEQAWAMMPQTEDTSVVWTEEIAQAHGVVYDLLQQGDKVAARMAFKEAYSKLVSDARDAGVPVKWTASFGANMLGRQQALIEAINNNRLPAEYAITLLPPEYGDALLIQTNTQHPRLSGPPDPKVKERLRMMIAGMKAIQ